MILEILSAFIIALILVALFVFGLGRLGPWGSFWSFLLIVFLGSLLAILFIPPIGPVWYGIAWIDILMVALLFGLLLAAAPTSKMVKGEKKERGEENPKTKKFQPLGLFFWLLLTFFVILIVIGLTFTF